MNKDEPQQFTVMAGQAGQRLDVFVVSRLPAHSRASLQKLIKSGNITVNGAQVKPRYVLKENDTISLHTPAVETVTASPAALPSPTILYEDTDMVVIDKPAGVTVHPGVGTPPGGTIADWFLARYPEASDVGEDPSVAGPPTPRLRRAGLVHRLDKDTSGVLVLAKTQMSYDHLKLQFQRRYAKKEYLALVYGVPGEARGRINRPLSRSTRNPLRRTVLERQSRPHGRGAREAASKEAITEWRQEESFHETYCLLRVFPETGRTHQIRAHLHWLGFPIVGDHLYTFKRQRPPEGVRRQLLHAEKLTLNMPNKERRVFVSPLAPDFRDVIESLRGST